MALQWQGLPSSLGAECSNDQNGKTCRDKEGFSCCRAFCYLPTPLSCPCELLPALAPRILTWVRDLKPRGYQKHTLPGICPSIEAVLGAVRREDICHCEDEAEQPGHKDGQDDLKWSKKKPKHLCQATEVVVAGKTHAFSTVWVPHPRTHHC